MDTVFKACERYMQSGKQMKTEKLETYPVLSSQDKRFIYNLPVQACQEKSCEFYGYDYVEETKE